MTAATATLETLPGTRLPTDGATPETAGRLPLATLPTHGADAVPTPVSSPTGDGARPTVGHGIRAMLPVAVGLVPFGMSIGATAANLDVPGGPLAVASLLVYSGSAQLATVQLSAAGAGLAAVAVVLLVVNARMVLFSAAMRTHWVGAPLHQRLVAAYLLVDPVVVLCNERLRAGHRPDDRRRFYLATALTLWVVWMGANAVGFLGAAALPTSSPIMLATPLVLLALALGPTWTRVTLATVTAAAVAAAVLPPLPADLGFLVAALAGAGVGWLVERQATHRAGAPASSDREVAR